MNGTDWGTRRPVLDWIAFGVFFVVISGLLCFFVHISVVLYFALLFLSGVIALIVSSTVLHWFERMILGMVGRNGERRRRSSRRSSRGYWHW